MVDHDVSSPSPAQASNHVPRWLVAALLGAGLVIVVLLGVIVALLIVGGDESSVSSAADTSGSPEKVETFEVNGDLTLTDPSRDGLLFVSGGGCVGTGGYSDISSDAQVVIKDASGTALATGRLGSGSKLSSYQCRFPFSVSDVPEATGPYSVEVSHRGGISFDEASHNNIHLTLGG